MKKIGIAAGALALVGAAATPASAQSTPPSSPATPPPSANTPPTVTVTPTPTETTGRDVGIGGWVRAPVRAPSNAFELGVDAGYTQGFGNIQTGRGVSDVANAGGTFGVSAGYRIDPRWSIAARGQYQGFGAGPRTPNGTTVRGATAGIEGTYHISPYNRLDPYVSLGTGYRAIIESPPGNAPNAVTHGIELGKIEVGLDVRPSESISIAPVIGADVNMFMARTGGGTESAALTDRGINTFVYAGVKGRFDIGGSRNSQAEQQVGRR